MMIAANDPFVGRNAAGNFRDDVVHRLRVPVEFHFQMNFRRPRSDVIRNWQISSPLVRRHGPFERGQQRLGVAVGNRQHRNSGEALRIFQRQSLSPRRGADAGSERIARTRRSKVHHASALHAIGIAHRPLRKHVVARVTIILRLRIDQATDGSVLRRNFGFHSAPGVIILGDHDRALHRDAEPVEFLVVLRQAIVHKDQRSAHIAVDGIRIVSGKLLGLLIRGGIDCQCRLLQLRRELRGLDHFQHANLGSRKQHVESLNVRVESPFLEAGENPLGVVFVVRRTDVMGPRTEPPHVFPQIVRIRDRSKLRLPVSFSLAGARRIAHQRSLVGGKCQRWNDQVEDQQHGGEASHAIPF